MTKRRVLYLHGMGTSLSESSLRVTWLSSVFNQGNLDLLSYAELYLREEGFYELFIDRMNSWVKKNGGGPDIIVGESLGGLLGLKMRSLLPGVPARLFAFSSPLMGIPPKGRIERTRRIDGVERLTVNKVEYSIGFLQWAKKIIQESTEVLESTMDSSAADDVFVYGSKDDVLGPDSVDKTVLKLQSVGKTVIRLDGCGHDSLGEFIVRGHTIM